MNKRHHSSIFYMVIKNLAGNFHLLLYFHVLLYLKGEESHD